MDVCIHVCLCTAFMHGPCKCKKWASDPLELELLMVMSHHMGAGNVFTMVFIKSNGGSTSIAL